MNETQHVDEIDLSKLFVKLIQAIKANKLPLILFSIAGLLMGCLLYSKKDPTVESKMLVGSSILSESFGEKLIFNLNHLLADKDTVVLSKKLNMPVAQVLKIANVKIENEVTEKSEDRFYLMITARVKDQKILRNLQNGLIQYLENNNYVKVRVKQKKELSINMIKRINEEINDLEAFKTKIYKGNFFETTKGNMSFDPTVVNSKILDLIKERASYENSLELIESVQVIDGFTVFDKPLGSKLSAHLILGWVIGLLLGCIFVLVRSLEKMVRNSN